jgi:hypothetical protein
MEVICASETSVLDVALARHFAPSDSNSVNQDPIFVNPNLDPLLSGNAFDSLSDSDPFLSFSMVEEGEVSEDDEIMDWEDGDCGDGRHHAR